LDEDLPADPAPEQPRAPTEDRKPPVLATVLLCLLLAAEVVPAACVALFIPVVGLLFCDNPHASAGDCLETGIGFALLVGGCPAAVAGAALVAWSSDRWRPVAFPLAVILGWAELHFLR
jgi:hypothetical protein